VIKEAVKFVKLPRDGRLKLEYNTLLGVFHCGAYAEIIDVSLLSVELTAHRPYTEGPTYGNPFQDHEVPDDQEESPGAGIRINGDTETAANENDLIEVELEVAPFPVPSGVQYFLRRNNSNVTVWDNRQGEGTALLDSGTEAAFTVTASPMSVWVENPSGGDADFELVAKDPNGDDVCSDKIHFYPFSSVVVLFEGEFGDPADPPQTGISQLALDIYQNGYDVHLYNEPDAGDPDTEIDAFNEIENAAPNRQANSVAIIGYSHGGGSTFNVSEALDNDPTAFNLNFTAYIDAVTQDAITQENRRPVNSAFHVNYYQEGSLADGWLDGGPIDNPPGADLEVNVDDPVATETHTTIDDDASVHEGITTRLYQRINR
jgi:hypothetical protein